MTVSVVIVEHESQAHEKFRAPGRDSNSVTLSAGRMLYQLELPRLTVREKVSICGYDDDQ